MEVRTPTMPPRRWFRSAAGTVSVLVCGTILSVAAVLWMAWHLIHQDLTLERQQARQGLEAAADTAGVLLDRALLQMAQSVADRAWLPHRPGSIMIRDEEGSFKVEPPYSLL